MTFILGTDEAGYGPNLGPLVISASLWKIPSTSNSTDLYQLLGELIHESGGHLDYPEQITIADSKKLYQPGGGLAKLEQALFPFLNRLSLSCSRWQEIWRALSADPPLELSHIPWYADFDCPLPIDAESETLEQASDALRYLLQSQQVQCCAVRSRTLFPTEFNQRVHQDGNKANVLSAATLQLVNQLIQDLPDEPIVIQCDKHGGRSKYGAMLQSLFPEYLVEVRHEGRQESVYRWGPPERRVEIRFAAKGERFLPAALASITSKYLRELAMIAFNRFWIQHLPSLKPTAGYPVDAKRFKTEIADCQKSLQIEDHCLWRVR